MLKDDWREVLEVGGLFARHCDSCYRILVRRGGIVRVGGDAERSCTCTRKLARDAIGEQRPSLKLPWDF